MKLPPTKSLLARIGGPKVHAAIEFLIHKRALLQQFADVEDFILTADEHADNYKGIEPNFLIVRRAVAEQLWGRGIYIGGTVLDTMIFRSIVHTDESDPIRHMLGTIRGLGLHRPGMVLFPLHSLGVLAGGLLQ